MDPCKSISKGKDKVHRLRRLPGCSPGALEMPPYLNWHRERKADKA